MYMTDTVKQYNRRCLSIMQETIVVGGQDAGSRRHCRAGIDAIQRTPQGRLLSSMMGVYSYAHHPLADLASFLVNELA